MNALSDYIINDGDTLIVRRPPSFSNEQWMDLQAYLDDKLCRLPEPDARRGVSPPREVRRNSSELVDLFRRPEPN